MSTISAKHATACLNHVADMHEQVYKKACKIINKHMENNKVLSKTNAELTKKLEAAMQQLRDQTDLQEQLIEERGVTTQLADRLRETTRHTDQLRTRITRQEQESIITQEQCGRLVIERDAAEGLLDLRFKS